MCVCVCLFLYLYLFFIYLFCVCVCVYLCVCACVYVCVHVYVCACVCVCVLLRTEPCPHPAVSFCPSAWTTWPRERRRDMEPARPGHPRAWWPPPLLRCPPATDKEEPSPQLRWPRHPGCDVAPHRGATTGGTRRGNRRRWWWKRQARNGIQRQTGTGT